MTESCACRLQNDELKQELALLRENTHASKSKALWAAARRGIRVAASARRASIAAKEATQRRLSSTAKERAREHHELSCAGAEVAAALGHFHC